MIGATQYRDTKKTGPGRPPIPIDYEVVRRLATIQCTDAEIAAMVEMTPEGFCKRKQRDNELLQAIEKGREQGKMSIRRMQYRAAEKGNATMLIWLGKQFLGQRDQREITGADGSPLIPQRQLTDEQLMAIAAAGLATGPEEE